MTAAENQAHASLLRNRVPMAFSEFGGAVRPADFQSVRSSPISDHASILRVPHAVKGADSVCGRTPRRATSSRRRCWVNLGFRGGRAARVVRGRWATDRVMRDADDEPSRGAVRSWAVRRWDRDVWPCWYSAALIPAGASQGSRMPSKPRTLAGIRRRDRRRLGQPRSGGTTLAPPPDVAARGRHLGAASTGTLEEQPATASRRRVRRVGLVVTPACRRARRDAASSPRRPKGVRVERRRGPFGVFGVRRRVPGCPAARFSTRSS